MRLWSLVCLLAGFLLSSLVTFVVFVAWCDCHYQDGGGISASLPWSNDEGEVYSSGRSPPFLHDQESDSESRAKTMATEYGFSVDLLVAVLSPRKSLETLVRASYDTWAMETDKNFGFSVFVGGADPVSSYSGDLPVVRLKHVTDMTTTHRPSASHLLGALLHIYRHELDRYQWFMLTQADTYVARRDLEKLLGRMDSSVPVYMGRGYAEHRWLFSSQRYCLGETGLIISKALLKELGPMLKGCLARSKTGQDGDVTLGECLDGLGVSCSISTESQSYFYYDLANMTLDPSVLWHRVDFFSPLVFSPVWSTSHMYALHYFVKMRELHYLKFWLLKAERTVCNSLPSEFSPSPYASVAKDCHPVTSLCSDAPPPSIITRDFLTLPDNKPTHSWDLVMYQFSDGRWEYSEDAFFPVGTLHIETASHLDFVITEAVKSINKEEGSRYQFHSLQGAFMRYMSSYGKQFLLDLELSDRDNDGALSWRRVNLIRPPQSDVIVLPGYLENKKDQLQLPRVNVIVPISEVGDCFANFMKAYEGSVLASKFQNVQLILPVFGSDAGSQVSKVIRRYRLQYPKALFKVALLPGEYSWLKGIEEGFQHLEDYQLAFLSNPEISFQADFLNKCQIHAIRGKQVYYPEHFNYYNFDYAYRFKHWPLRNPSLSRQNGYWDVNSFDSVCIFKSDFLSLGGDLMPNTRSTKEEDVFLVERILDRNLLEVVRAPEPSLRKVCHRVHCKSRSLYPDQLSKCLRHRTEGLGDKLQLTNYVLYLEDLVGIS